MPDTFPPVPHVSKPMDACPSSTLELLAHEVRMLVAVAETYGAVVTVEQKPLQPLAQGHYETVVSVRAARK